MLWYNIGVQRRGLDYENGFPFSYIYVRGQMKVKNVEEIKEFLSGVLKDNGVKDIAVCEVEFKQGKNPSLTVYIDKDGGVDFNSCELIHNLIDAPLDDFDPTYNLPYTLNVSSMGIDRPFKTDKDFDNNIGLGVEVKLYSQVQGKKYYEGTLIKYDCENVVIKTDKGETLSLSRKNIVKISKQIIF